MAAPDAEAMAAEHARRAAMDAATAGDQQTAPPLDEPSKAPDSEPPSLGVLLSGLWDDLPGLFSDRVHLLALELKRARGALARMVGLLVLAAILGLTAWVTFWVLVVAAAMRYGVPWDGACLFVLAINVFAAWFAIRRTARLAGYLALPATMRQLTLKRRHPANDNAGSAAAGTD